MSPDDDNATLPDAQPAVVDDDVTQPDISTVGDVTGFVSVQIGPQFLELFSEHLYSSPNKAFEELVSNSWDAGAKTVHIGMSSDLTAHDASVWVLDDGVSMDADGFEALWSVATSRKRNGEGQSSRPQIGKFGIGKLATYILADCLTYVCKADDGVVRAVTMDYRRIDNKPGVLHIEPLPLEVRQLDETQLAELLATFPAGEKISKLIVEGVPAPASETDYENEFGGTDREPLQPTGTWTLVVLTSLKEAGRAMQAGHIKRMLRYALPLSSSISMTFNDAPLYSVKVGTDVSDKWVLGTNLGISSITLDAPDEEDTQEDVAPATIRVVELSNGDGPHVTIDGVDGVITGTVKLYVDRISGGKSEALGSSNGFFINVRGRVINADDPYFGLKNLNHSAWARFRATIRADGLDPHLSVNREGVLESPALHVFRKFLFTLFNKARSSYDASIRASWPNVGQVLTETWGTVPLQALRRVVTDGLSGRSELPLFVDAGGVDAPSELARLAQAAPEDAADFISDVVLEDITSDRPFVWYEIDGHRVVVNNQHPFAQEHGETHEQQLLLRDAALVDLLTQAYMADVGIEADVLAQVADYRDQTLRLIAQRRRRTGVQLAALLAEATRYDKGLERIVGDALEFLGFKVRRMGQSGKTEGVASAPAASDEPGLASSYSFTYDAKSAERGKVKTGNVGVAGLVRHRVDEQANHTLVVAPDYEAGALDDECTRNEITPIRAADLARLLVLVATRGPIDLREFQGVFENYTPDAAAEWVATFIETANSRPTLRYDELLAALEVVGHTGPDAVTVSVLAREIRRLTGSDDFPTRNHVLAVVRALEVLVPNLVRTSGDNVYLGTTPGKLREAIREQLRSVPEEFRTGVDEPTASTTD